MEFNNLIKDYKNTIYYEALSEKLQNRIKFYHTMEFPTVLTRKKKLAEN